MCCDIKNIIRGGYVKSKSDGDIHYITAWKLLKLYKLNPRECLLIDNWDDERDKLRGHCSIETMKWYHPRLDGNYDTE